MVTQAAATPGRQLLQLSFKLFVRQVLTCRTTANRVATYPSILQYSVIGPFHSGSSYLGKVELTTGWREESWKLRANIPSTVKLTCLELATWTNVFILSCGELDIKFKNQVGSHLPKENHGSTVLHKPRNSSSCLPNFISKNWREREDELHRSTCTACFESQIHINRESTWHQTKHMSMTFNDNSTMIKWS